MAEAIQPRPAIGPSVAAVAITAITAVSSLGVPTYDTTTNINMVSYWRDYDIDYDSTTRDNAPSSTTQRNNQIIDNGFTLTLTGFVTDLTGVTAANPAALLRYLNAYDLFKVVITRAGEIVTCWVTRQRANDNGTREQILQRVTFQSIWVSGVSNPTMTSAL